MNTEKIEKLKKSLSNSLLPADLKPKIEAEIKRLEDLDSKQPTKTVAKKTSKAKPSRTKTPKRTAMSLAKEIRKEGESWNDARARASKMMKEKSHTATKDVETELSKLAEGGYLTDPTFGTFQNQVFADGGGVEQKKYNMQFNVGKAKYVINTYDGVKKNKDGSEFYDIHIFKTKSDLDEFQRKLIKDGYKYTYADGGGVDEWTHNLKYLTSKKVYFDIITGKVYPKMNLKPNMSKGKSIDEYDDKWFETLNDRDLATVQNYINNRKEFADGGGVGERKFEIKFDKYDKNMGEIITPYKYKIIGYSDSFQLKVKFRELYKGTYSFNEYNICQFIIESRDINSAIKLAIERLKYIFKEGVAKRNSDKIFVVSGFEFDEKNTKKPYTPSFMENTHSMNQFTENSFKTKKGDLLKYDTDGDGYGFWYLVNKDGERISNRLKGSIFVGYISDGVIFEKNDKYENGGFMDGVYANGGVMSDGRFKLRGFPPIDKAQLMELYDDFQQNFGSNIERFTKHYNRVHDSKLRLTDVKELMDYAKLNFSDKMAEGGKIKDQYEGRTPDDIWNNLSKQQRGHFLYDHVSEIEQYKNIEKLPSSEIIKAYNSDWSSLDKDIKNRFANHTREGQYAKGGSVEKKYNSMLKEDKEDLMETQIGVGRTPYKQYEKYSDLSEHHKKLVNRYFANKNMYWNMATGGNINKNTTKMRKQKLKKGDTVTIYGKRWFDRVNGNTYHTAEVEVNGTTLGKSPMTYGYDDQYLETGKEILLQHYDLPRGMTERSPMWQLRDNGVTLTKYVTDGLKRDLAKGGGVKTKNGQTYNYGRVWTNDHNEFDKGSDHEVEYRRKKKFELGGTVVTDLAGHTGGGTGGLNAGMPLDGFSNTSYTGLVGETGAMSSGEMFAKGGSVNSKFDLSGYKKFRTFNDLEEAKEYVDMDRKKYSRAKESVVIKEGNKFQVWVIPASGIETGNRVYEAGGGLPSGASQSYMITESLGNPAQHFAKGGGVKTKNGQTYNYGRVWTKDHNEFDKGSDHEVEYRRKKSSFFAKGGSMEKIKYDDVLEVLKEKLEESTEELPRGFDNYDSFTGEEVEKESRDGFIAYTDGGYEVTWFEYMSYFTSTGYTLPTKPLDDEMQRQVDYNYQLAKETFVENYPEIVEELGEENIDYNSLYEAGYESEAEELSEMEMDFDGEDSIMCQIGAYYFNNNNYRGIEGKHTLRLFGVVNLESPYHRRGNLEDSYDIDITFDSISELKEKVDAGLKEIIDWFGGKNYNDSTTEMKIRRMADGGSFYENPMDDYEKAVINNLIIRHDLPKNKAFEFSVKGSRIIEGDWVSGKHNSQKTADKIIKKFKLENGGFMDGVYAKGGGVEDEMRYSHQIGKYVSAYYNESISNDDNGYQVNLMFYNNQDDDDYFDEEFITTNSPKEAEALADKINEEGYEKFMPKDSYAKGGGVGTHKYTLSEAKNMLGAEKSKNEGFSWFVSDVDYYGEDDNEQEYGVHLTDKELLDLADEVGDNYAKGGKVSPFKNIMETNTITEKEINLIKLRMNNDKVDEATQEVIDYIWDNSPQLTPDQNKKGIDYLRNLWKSPTGKERTNNPFGYREQDALETFEYFELRGFYDAGNRYRKFYVPLYTCVGADSNFEYAFYNGEVNILG